MECVKCKQELSDDCFYAWKDTERGSRIKSRCKDCCKQAAKEQYKGNPDRAQKKSKKNTYKIRKRNQAFIIEYLTSRCCEHCNESDIRVLEFDHLNPEEKLIGICQAVHRGWSIKRLETEIKKCRILCANCHRKVTAKSRGYYRESYNDV